MKQREFVSLDDGHKDDENMLDDEILALSDMSEGSAEDEVSDEDNWKWGDKKNYYDADFVDSEIISTDESGLENLFFKKTKFY